jgi:uncharacterized protein YggE
MKTHKLAVYGIIMLSLTASLAQASEIGIEVTGTAKETVIPDMATLSFSINSKGKELIALKTDIDKKTESVINLCKKLGVEPKNMTSAEISIHPQYNHQDQSFIGYEVSRNIKVTLNNLDKYSDLVNGAIQSGITTISNISLDTKDRKILENKALESAIKAAKKKAVILATSSGTGVGNVLHIKENTQGHSRFDHYRPVLRSASLIRGITAKAAFEPGEISVTATVSVRYAIGLKI